MNLDHILTQLAVKMKQFVVLDVNFPNESLHEFGSAYPHRYVHMPSHHAMVLEMAAGMATLGKLVLVIGVDEVNLPDSTLSVKVLKRAEGARWEDLEASLRQFGTGVLLIPEDESRRLEST